MKERSKVLIILLLFVLYNLFFIFLHDDYIISDDFTYFYMGKLVYYGNKPYIDFFYAHPPLQILAYAGLISLFGSVSWLVHIIPLLSGLVSAYLIYKITDRWLFTLFFLTIFPTFHLLSIGFGMNFGLMFILFAIYCKNPYVSGISAALSVFSRLHYIIPAFFAMFTHKRQGFRIKYVVGSSVMAILFLILLIIMPNMMKDTIFYHLLKDFGYFSVIRWFIIGYGIVGLFVCYKTRYFSLFFSYFCFLIVIKTVFAYYMIPMAAFFILGLSEKDITKWYYSVILSVLIGLSIGATVLSYIDIYQNKQEVKSLVEAVPINSTICGNNEIVPLIAIKTNSMIKDNEVDTNFQRKKKIDCNGSITIYRFREFFSCKIILKEKKYTISVC